MKHFGLADARRLAALAREWDAQWARFCEALGRAPRFVDGHQHVHQFPVIRDALLQEMDGIDLAAYCPHGRQAVVVQPLLAAGSD
mgnify:CR=1 FL=1